MNADAPGVLRRALPAIERLLLTLWVGGLWSVGFLAAPRLFRLLVDRQLAGSLAGELFTAIAYLGIGAASLLLLCGLLGQGRSYLAGWRLRLLLVMVAITLAGEFLLHPQVAELRQSGLIAGSSEARHFAMLHGISWLLYLANAVLGAVLVAAGRGRHG